MVKEGKNLIDPSKDEDLFEVWDQSRLGSMDVNPNIESLVRLFSEEKYEEVVDAIKQLHDQGRDKDAAYLWNNLMTEMVSKVGLGIFILLAIIMVGVVYPPLFQVVLQVYNNETTLSDPKIIWYMIGLFIFSAPLLASLPAGMTLIKMRKHQSEIARMLQGGTTFYGEKAKTEQESEEETETFNDLLERTGQEKKFEYSWLADESGEDTSDSLN